VAVDVKDVCRMLLRTAADEQVWKRDAVPPLVGKLALCSRRDRERLGVHSEL
jgi:hypothetical protein